MRGEGWKCPQRLNAIDAESDSPLAQVTAQFRQIRAPAGDEMTRGERHQACALIDLLNDIFETDPAQTTAVDPQPPDFDPPFRQRHPRINVGWVVVEVDDH